MNSVKLKVMFIKARWLVYISYYTLKSQSGLKIFILRILCTLALNIYTAIEQTAMNQTICLRVVYKKHRLCFNNNK